MDNYKFIQDYKFMKCNSNLLSETNKDLLDTILQMYVTERYYLQVNECFYITIYKSHENKYIIVGEQDIISKLGHPIYSSEGLLQIDNDEFFISEENRLPNTVYYEKLSTAILGDWYALVNNIVVGVDEVISLNQYDLEICQKFNIEQLYYIQIGDFNMLFDLLYCYITGESLNSRQNRLEDDCLKYLENIFSTDKVMAFMNIYTLLEELEKQKGKPYTEINKLFIGQNSPLCGCSNRASVNPININQTNSSYYYLFKTAQKINNSQFQAYCKHNIRGLRHAIVHGNDRTNPNFKKKDAIEIIQKDFNKIVHLMISYIEDHLI